MLGTTVESSIMAAIALALPHLALWRQLQGPQIPTACSGKDDHVAEPACVSL